MQARGILTPRCHITNPAAVASKSKTLEIVGTPCKPVIVTIGPPNLLD